MTATQSGTALPLRPELDGKVPYGAPQIDVPVRLNTNENPFPPPPHVRLDIEQRVAAQLASANRYPDRDALALRAALAGYVTATTGSQVSPDRIWAANGSNEVLQHLLQAFGGPGRRALGFEPTYSMHAMISEHTGTASLSVPRRDDFTINLDLAIAAIHREQPDVVFVCTPNNPTGTITPAEDILAIHDAADGIVIVDEAYIEFSRSPTSTHLLQGRPRLIVSRTMSKAFGFAAVRVGYLVAHPDVVSAMRLVRLPYHLSSLTQEAALGALAHYEELLQTVALLREEGDRLSDGIRSLGYRAHPSDANFVLFGRFPDARAAWHELVHHGILVRDVGIPGHLRVSVGTPAENDVFLQALKEIS